MNTVFDPKRFTIHPERPLLIGGVGQGALTAQIVSRFGTSFIRAPQGKFSGSFYVKDSMDKWVVLYHPSSDMLGFYQMGFDEFKKMALSPAGSAPDVAAISNLIVIKADPRYKYLGLQILEVIKSLE